MASSSSSSMPPTSSSVPPCRSCDVLPLLRLLFQDSLIQPALQLPYMPSELLRIIDEYIGVDPPPPVIKPAIWYRGCEWSSGATSCPVLSTEEDLHAELLQQWQHKREVREEEEEEQEEGYEPSFNTLIDEFNEHESGETPWMQWNY